MRLLALADAPPHAPIADLVAANDPDLIVVLGDLEPAWADGLESVAVPRLGVHGNHDEPGLLADLGVEDVHLRTAEHGGLTFAGLAGCPRYSRDGPHEWTEEQAAGLVARLPAAEVLVTHCPPAGVNDEPDDPVHRGWAALRGWVEREQPRLVLHGHTHPLPGRRVAAVGPTRVVHVRGSAIVDVG